MSELNNMHNEEFAKVKACTYEEAVELTGHGRYNYVLLIACSIISHAVALDIFGYSVVVAAATCDLNLGLTEAGILASAPFAGVLFAFPWGYYADTRGRKQALLLSTSVGFVFAAISSLAGSWQFMLVVKLLGSSFSTASYSLTMTYLGEGTGSQHSNKYLFIMNSINLLSEFSSFGIAYILLPLDFEVPVPWLGITYRPWRLYTIVVALPLAIGALLLIYLQESPKFLASRGEVDKALETLKYIHKINGGKEEYQVKQIVTADEVSNLDKSTFWESIVNQTVPIFRPPLLWRTLQLFFLMALCCSTNNVFLMWYPIIMNVFFNSLANGFNEDKNFCDRTFTDNSTVSNDSVVICNDSISTYTLYSGMVYGIFYCCVNLAVARVASRRRLVLILCLLVSGISGAMVDLKQPVANMVFFTLLQATSVGIPCVGSYFVDLYPTAYRGLATSLCMMTARLFSFAGVNLIGAVIANNCSLTFYCWSIFVFSGIIVSLLLPSDSKPK